MRELQLAELSLVTGGQSTPAPAPAPTNTGTTTTTTTNTDVTNNSVTGNTTFGPGGNSTGGSLGFTWGSSHTTTTTTTVVRPNDPVTPKEPTPRTEQQSEVGSDLDGLY